MISQAKVSVVKESNQRNHLPTEKTAMHHHQSIKKELTWWGFSVLSRMKLQVGGRRRRWRCVSLSLSLLCVAVVVVVWSDTLKNPRVYVQNVSVCTGNTSTCPLQPNRPLVPSTCRWARLPTHRQKEPHQVCCPCSRAHLGRVATACVSPPKRLGCLHGLAHASKTWVLCGGKPF